MRDADRDRWEKQGRQIDKLQHGKVIVESCFGNMRLADLKLIPTVDIRGVMDEMHEVHVHLLKRFWQSVGEYDQQQEDGLMEEVYRIARRTDKKVDDDDNWR